MNKDVNYNGYTAQPSDYQAPDGDLAAAINLIPEDGGLKSILPPHIINTLPPGQYPLGLHADPRGDQNLISWRKSNVSTDKFDLISSTYPALDSESVIASISDQPITMSILGNTITIATTGKPVFILWKDRRYIYLGSEPPFINIEFALALEGCLGDGWHKISFATNPEGHGRESTGIGTSTDKDTLQYQQAEQRRNDSDNAVMGHFNLYVRQQITSNGFFYQPFFVKYAYRLFDGSYAWLSSPVLMLPTVAPPFFEVDGYNPSDRNYFQDISIHGHSIPFFQLFYRVLPFQQKDIDAWSDIISGIDFFISPPIYTFKNPDSDHHCRISSGGAEYIFSDLFREKAVDTLSPVITDPSSSGGAYQSGRHPSRGDVDGNYFFGHFSGNYKLFTDFQSSLGHYRPGTVVDGIDYTVKDHFVSSQELNAKPVIALPHNDKFLEDITHASQFYKVASWDIADIASTDNFTALIVETADLTNLLTRPVLPDDTATASSYISRIVSVYNRRMHFAGVKCIPPQSLHPRTLVAYSNPSVGSNLSKIIKIEVWTRRSGAVIRSVLSSPDKITGNLDTFSIDSLLTQFPRWIFYPDNNAFAMRITAICQQTSQSGDNITVEFSTRTFNLPLRQHEHLNGAYYFGGIAVDSTPAENECLPAAAVNDAPAEIDVPSSIYISDVDNPFVFPFKNTVSVGSGTILGIATAAKALSQGQFGQFPLYAFTTEGVWALEVSATGTYSARQPITRDVCISPEGITQLDSAVLFPTDRGIMMLSGSTSACISDPINTDYPFSPLASLPHAKRIADLARLSPDVLDIIPFSKFLADARMLYDYSGQRVILYRPSTPYAYVYSLRSKLWGMMLSDIVTSVNSYPRALAIDSAGNLLDYSAKPDPEASTIGDVVSNRISPTLSRSSASSPMLSSAILITRPLSLDAHDILKTVDTVIQRGHFRRDHVSSILYGSRDLHSWHLIRSSKDHYLRGFRGTPYKYFRIALIARLSPDESISGASVQFNLRQTNHPR